MTGVQTCALPILEENEYNHFTIILLLDLCEKFINNFISFDFSNFWRNFEGIEMNECSLLPILLIPSKLLDKEMEGTFQNNLFYSITFLPSKWSVKGLSI